VTEKGGQAGNTEIRRQVVEVSSVSLPRPEETNSNQIEFQYFLPDPFDGSISGLERGILGPDFGSTLHSWDTDISGRSHPGCFFGNQKQSTLDLKRRWRSLFGRHLRFLSATSRL